MSKVSAFSIYPRPQAVGGRLIRQVIRELKSQGIALPISSHILIATSGGSDSVALAHLLARYGRRVAPRSSIELLHINHGWRGVESDRDARFVRELGRELGVPVTVHRLKAQAPNGDSLEEVARRARQSLYERLARRKQAVVLTAHQAEDVAETLLWRLFTGAARTHGGGIVFRHGVELRPLLGVRKAELQAYLREEGRSWREDSTNHAGRFMRSRMRQDLLPAVEKLFPRAIEHLTDLACEAQRQVDERSEALPPLGGLLAASGLRLRRSHWEALLQHAQNPTGRRKEFHLPGGWRLFYDSERGSQRWILEKTRSSGA